MNDKISPHFYNFLAEGNIVCGMNCGNSSEAIEELVKRLGKNNAGIDAAEVMKAVIDREKVVPTVVAPGLAVPHARIEGLPNMLVALGTSISGIDFHARGMPPVNVIMLILTPKDDPGLHLQVLAGLAKDFKDNETIRMVATMESPVDIINYFTTANVEIVDYLRAGDVMTSDPLTLLENDTLKTAIETFAITPGLHDIPLLDDDGDLRGVISLEDIIRFSLPEHMLWMNDLTPIRRFQPFAEMLRDDHETRLADFMREDYVSVNEDIPAIQLAKIFCQSGGLRQIIVMRNGKPCGVVNIKNFITKLFWA